MDVQVGVSREGLSMAKLKKFVIPFPSKDEQKRIAAKANQLLELCSDLEEHINKSKIEVDSLTRAVLMETISY